MSSCTSKVDSICVKRAMPNFRCESQILTVVVDVKITFAYRVHGILRDLGRTFSVRVCERIPRDFFLGWPATCDWLAPPL